MTLRKTTTITMVDDSPEVRPPVWYPHPAWVDDESDRWCVPTELRRDYAAQQMDYQRATRILAGKYEFIREGVDEASFAKWRDVMKLEHLEESGQEFTLFRLSPTIQSVNMAMHVEALASARQAMEQRANDEARRIATTEECASCGADCHPVVSGGFIRQNFPDYPRRVEPSPVLCHACVEPVRAALTALSGEERLADGRTRQEAARIAAKAFRQSR